MSDDKSRAIPDPNEIIKHSPSETRLDPDPNRLSSAANLKRSLGLQLQPDEDYAPGRERVGGQTDYTHLLPPMDQEGVAGSLPGERKFEHRFIDSNLNPVPIAVREDQALMVYEFGQRQYNVALTAGGLVPAGSNLLDTVESGWEWEVTRVAVFGTATGVVKLYAGTVGDDGSCFVVQAGVAAVLGGITALSGMLLTHRTPILIATAGADASANIAVGLWYRRCKWVWNAPSYIQRDALRTDIAGGHLYDDTVQAKDPVN